MSYRPQTTHQHYAADYRKHLHVQKQIRPATSMSWGGWGSMSSRVKTRRNKMNKESLTDTKSLLRDYKLTHPIQPDKTAKSTAARPKTARVFTRRATGKVSHRNAAKARLLGKPLDREEIAEKLNSYMQASSARKASRETSQEDTASKPRSKVAHECLCNGECRRGLGPTFGSAGPSAEQGWNVEMSGHTRLVEDLNNTLDTLLHEWRRERAGCGHQIVKGPYDSAQHSYKRPSTAPSNAEKGELGDSKEDTESEWPDPGTFSFDEIGRQDFLYTSIETLEDGLREMKIWDNVLRNISETRSICPSRSLAVLLARIRDNYNQYFKSLEFLFVEVRRRLKVDWRLDTLQQKQKMTSTLIDEKLETLDGELEGELKSLDDRSNALSVARTTLFNASENAIYHVDDTETDDRLVMPPPLEENDGSGSDDADDGVNFRRRTDLGSHLQLFYEGKNEEERKAATSMKIRNLKNGSKINGSVSFASYYYRFHVDADDVALQVTLTTGDSLAHASVRKPAPPLPESLRGIDAALYGDDDNYLELTLNYGSPPTKQSHSHNTNTIGVDECSLSVNEKAMKVGWWYLRLVGRGYRTKHFHLKFRVITGVLAFGNSLVDVMDDMDSELHWRKSIAHKMSLVENLLAHQKMVVQGPTKKKVKTSAVGIQALKAPPQALEVVQEGGELATGLLREYFTLPLPYAADLSPAPLLATVKMTGQFFNDKMSLDKTDDRSGVERMEFAGFLYNTFYKRYGVPKIAEIRLHEYLYNVKTHKANSKRLQFLSRALAIDEPVADTQDVDWYLDVRFLVRKHCQKFRVAFADNEEGQHKISKPVALAVVKEFFQPGGVLPFDVKEPPLSDFIAQLGKSRSRMAKHRFTLDTDVFLQNMVAVCQRIRDRLSEQPSIDALFDISDVVKAHELNASVFITLVRSHLSFISPLECWLLYFHGALLSGQPFVVNLEGFRKLCYIHSLLQLRARGLDATPDAENDVEKKHVVVLDMKLMFEQSGESALNNAEENVDKQELLLHTRNHIPFPTREELETSRTFLLDHFQKLTPIVQPKKKKKTRKGVVKVPSTTRAAPKQQSVGELIREFEEAGTPQTLWEQMPCSDEVKALMTSDPEHLTLVERCAVSFEYLSLVWHALSPMLKNVLDHMAEEEHEKHTALDLMFQSFSNLYTACTGEKAALVGAAWTQLRGLLRHMVEYVTEE